MITRQQGIVTALIIAMILLAAAVVAIILNRVKEPATPTTNVTVMKSPH